MIRLTFTPVVKQFIVGRDMNHANESLAAIRRNGCLLFVTTILPATQDLLPAVQWRTISGRGRPVLRAG
jgi:hypothetical protein